MIDCLWDTTFLKCKKLQLQQKYDTNLSHKQNTKWKPSSGIGSRGAKRVAASSKKKQKHLRSEECECSLSAWSLVPYPSPHHHNPKAEHLSMPPSSCKLTLECPSHLFVQNRDLVNQFSLNHTFMPEHKTQVKEGGMSMSYKCKYIRKQQKTLQEETDQKVQMMHIS